MTTWIERAVETPKKVSGGVEGTIRRASNGEGIQVLGASPFDALRFVTGPGFLKTGGRKGRSYGVNRLYSGPREEGLLAVIFHRKRIDESDRAELGSSQNKVRSEEHTSE